MNIRNLVLRKSVLSVILFGIAATLLFVPGTTMFALSDAQLAAIDGGGSDRFAGPVAMSGGDLLWEDQFDRAGGGDQAVAVAVDRNSVFTAGVGGTPGNWDFLVRAYNAKTGSLRWEDEFDEAGGTDSASAIILKGNRVFAAGGVTNAAGNTDILVRAYNAETGALLWEDQYDKAGGSDRTLDITVMGNRVFLAGRVTNAAGNNDYLVRAYNSESGALLWEDQLDKAGGSDVAIGVTVKGNRVFVAGLGTNSAGNEDFLVRAYNAKTGALLWEDQFDKAGLDEVAGSIVARGNRVFVGGSGIRDAAVGDLDFVLRAYDAATGVLLWEDQPDQGEADTTLADMAIQGNRLFVAIQTTNGSLDWLVRAYDTKDRHRDMGGTVR